MRIESGRRIEGFDRHPIAVMSSVLDEALPLAFQVPGVRLLFGTSPARKRLQRSQRGRA